jgi:hypothetical protein
MYHGRAALLISSVRAPRIPDGPGHRAGKGRKHEEDIAVRHALSIGLLAAIVFGSLAMTAPPVMAEETSCVGTIGARTLDNVRVPQGRSCTLNGTTVKGTVKIERGATLHAKGVRVIGNVQGENHKYVSVTGASQVGGSVQLDQGGAFQVANSTVAGIQVKSNSGTSSLRGNRVNADIQVFSHSGKVDISSNRVGGNLQCKENSPAPTGGNNIVQGNKEDQCRRL